MRQKVYAIILTVTVIVTTLLFCTTIETTAGEEITASGSMFDGIERGLSADTEAAIEAGKTDRLTDTAKDKMISAVDAENDLTVVAAAVSETGTEAAEISETAAEYEKAEKKNRAEANPRRSDVRSEKRNTPEKKAEDTDRAAAAETTAVSESETETASEDAETAAAETEATAAEETSAEPETTATPETVAAVPETTAASVTEAVVPMMIQETVHQHSFYEASRTPSTCKTQGSVLYACSCGEMRTESLPLAAHSTTEVVQKAADCHSTGVVNTVCTTCGQVMATRVTPVASHVPGSWTTVKQAGPGTEGQAVQTCTVCGMTLATSKIPALPTDNASLYCQRVLELVNAERAAAGLAPLTWSQGAANAAMIRAQESRSVFDHVRPNGSSCFTALDDCGVSFMTAGENLAAGQMTPEAAVASWMSSPGHRENILDPNFTQLGVGLVIVNDGYGYYWSQFFIG